MDEEQESERYHEWTSCEMYGHIWNFEGTCRDCGEPREG